MMKLGSSTTTTTTAALLLLHLLLACPRSSYGATLDVATCEDLLSAAAATATSSTVGVLTAGGISCDDWTTFEVTNNRLKLVAPDTGFDADHVFSFVNVRFLVSSSTLRVDPAVSFATGEAGGRQALNGGALHVAESGYARFLSDVSMNEISIRSVTDEGSDVSPDTWYGGCIYSQGKIRFEGPFEAEGCATVGGGESAPGDGGGIFNGPTAVLIFKKPVSMIDNGTFDNEGNRGGAIRNEGKVTVTKDASFVDNASAGGGAISNTGVMKFLKNSLAIFSENRTYDSGRSGGQVSNSGEMKFNGGAVFESGFTEANGGAFANYGTLTISKSAVFSENVASYNGGAIYTDSDSTLDLPNDTVFENNSVRYPDYYDCNDWYQEQADGSFVCLP